MSTSASLGLTKSALVALLVVVASCSGQTDALGSAGPPGGGGDALDDDVAFRHEGRPAEQTPLLAEDGGLLHPVVLVTIDGVRWQEVFEGTDVTRTRGPVRTAAEIVPNLHALAHDRGAVVGAPRHGTLAASGPDFVSLPGYTEILTGRTSRACKDNDCPGADTSTLLDQASAAGARVAAFGSWEKIARAASAQRSAPPRAFVASAGRSGDATIAPWPGHGDYRPDKLTAAAALAHLEHERPDVLWVSLGDTDEHAHHGDYDAYVEALSEADAFVGRVVEALGRMGPRGARTHLVVTADHGRAADFRSHGGASPEAARVWLVASGPSFVARGEVRSPRVRHLADVAPTLRAVMGLAPDVSPGAGAVLDELFAGREERGARAQAETTPTGQVTPVPPSPQ